MNITRFILTAALALLGGSIFAQGQALWTRYPVISPDGKNIAFCYKGDIYTVNREGGMATQLTTHPGYDGYPVWSPDSRQIAFASDRNGGMDVFVMPATGGTPTRLTFHSSNEIPECFTPDGKQILFRSAVQADARYTEFPNDAQLYTVAVGGGRPELFLTFSAYHLRFNKSGDKLLYQDYKGYEDNWRKHHRSSVCRDIWMYDLKAKTFTNLTDQEVEDREPEFSGDEQSLYFLSERFGDFNVCKMSLGQPGQVEQLTHHSKHPVRFLSMADDGTLCYFYNGEIYTLREGEQPRKLKITVVTDQIEPQVTLNRLSSGATEMALSPDAKEMALVIRGDIFVASTEYGTTRRITNTPTQERSVSFSPDGKSLVYAAERNGKWGIYTMTLTDENDKMFTYARDFQEEQITRSDKACFQPAFSPDGKEIAYIEDRTEIKVIDLKTKKSRTVLPKNYNYSYSDGDQWYEWSPDGKWILAQYFEKGGWQYNDAALIKADGSQEIHNLTNSGYADQHPRWMMDGKAIVWLSDRAGYRSHGSWGSQYDAYALFLDPEAWDEFRMSKEELALAKEMRAIAAKEAAKDKDKKDKKEDGKKDGKKENADQKLPEVKIEFRNIEDRISRLTLNSSNLGDVILTKDGQKFYYLSKFEGGYDLWVRDLKENSTRILSKLRGYSSMEMDKSGKNIYLISNGRINKIDVNSGKMSGVAYNAELELRKPEERVYIFNHIWQQVADKFYDPDIHHVDWKFYKKEYGRFLPHINNNYDFAEMLSEMLGELNASHTGARYRAPGSSTPTAALGAFYDNSYRGDGLKIQEIIEKGPLTGADSKIKAGVIIEKINYQPIEAGKDYYHLLNNLAGKRTLLSLYNPQTKERWEEYVKPISYGRQSGLLYDRWVKQRKEMVDRLSDGQIGYIHIKAMDSESFRKVYSELLGRYRNRKAILLDTRHNGGGWLHEDLVTLLSGKKYAEFVPRNQFIGEDPLARWSKPSAVIMSEDNYSNAHGFPWAYKECQLGKLIGMPVPGTMTAVWWETQQDPSIVFGIPQVGMKDNQGRYLENLQLEPDIKVTNDPASAIEGRDLQLEAAVKSLK